MTCKYSDKFTEEYILHISKSDPDELYSIERIDAHFDRVGKEMTKYYSRRNWYYKYYVDTCKSQGVNPDKVLSYHISSSDSCSRRDAVNDHLTEIKMFVKNKQTIADIVEENNRVARMGKPPVEEKMKDTPEQPSKIVITIEIKK